MPARRLRREHPVPGRTIDGAKGVEGHRHEDKMLESFTVISPKNNWKPAKSGMKGSYSSSRQPASTTVSCRSLPWPTAAS
ncbi:MAG: hypothetical protein MZV70_13395 [Desulfobacterales bacterium]|nr:hypothetical protein [Desulfobacterales bacterium]